MGELEKTKSIVLVPGVWVQITTGIETIVIQGYGYNFALARSPTQPQPGDAFKTLTGLVTITPPWVVWVMALGEAVVEMSVS